MSFVTRYRLHEAKGFGAKIESRGLLFEAGRRIAFSLDKSQKWCAVEAIPRHKEIKEQLARKILKNLSAE